MTDKQGTRGTPCDMASCVAMMKKMMAHMGARCDCTEMMSRMKGQAEPGCCDSDEMVSDMMASCCGAGNEPKDEPAAQATQQA